MIRRGFWLLAGAALGVTGYRKATRLVQGLTGQSVLGAPAATGNRRSARLPAAARAAGLGRAQSQLAQSQLAQSQLAQSQLAQAQPARAQLASPVAALRARSAPVTPAPAKPAPVKPGAVIAAAVTQAAAAAGFVRDVRDGMAEYWDLHRSESDRSQRDHIWSGDGQQGPREH